MKLSAKTALIVSVLSITLSAHANGETQTNVETIAQTGEVVEMVGVREKAVSAEHFGGRGGGSIAFNNPFSKLSVDTLVSKFTPNVSTMLSYKNNWESAFDDVEKAIDKARSEKEKENTKEHLLQNEKEKKEQDMMDRDRNRR